MSIYKTSLNKSVRATLTTLLIVNVAFGRLANAQEEEFQVLSPMTIYATREADNTVSQRSEVKWETSIDPSIKKERSGNYTASDNTNPYNLKQLIESLGSPAVNIDLSYAKNSASLNADGRLALAMVLDALKHVTKGTNLQLTPINRSGQRGKPITQRRTESVYEILSRNKNINVELKPSKSLSGATSKSKRFDLYRIRLQRAT